MVAAEELAVELSFAGPAELDNRKGERGGADGTSPFSFFGFGGVGRWVGRGVCERGVGRSRGLGG